MTITLQRYEGETSSAVPQERQRQPRRITEGGWIFLVSAIGYLAVAGAMVHARIIFGDAASRVANGFFVLYSKDPHLPAIGAVWNPLPSFLVLPLLPFKSLFPALVRDGFAGNIESALCMAGAVYLLAGCLSRLGLSRGPRLVLTLIFALDPMIVLFAGSGESEAMLLLFVLLAVRSLISWLDDGGPGSLVVAGVAIGLAYLTRYEAVGVALAVAVTVGGVSMLRSEGTPRRRLSYALNDVALVFLPFVFAFALWAVSSKILVHQWFAMFSSQYGNSAQVGSAKSGIDSIAGSTPLQHAGYLAQQLHGLEPLILALLVVAAFLAVRRRDLTALAAPVVLGAVLAFDEAVFITSTSFGWLRFQIAVIPLAVLLAGTVIRNWKGSPRVALGVAVALTAIALPTTLVTLTSHKLAREETLTMLAAVAPSKANAQDRQHLQIYRTEGEVAAYIDRLDLPTGAVLTDSAYAFPVLLASDNAKAFTISSDRDFAAASAKPGAHGIHYILVPDPAVDPSDAVNHAYPTLYADGAGIAVQVAQWKQTSIGADWKLFKVG